ncbi:MAG: peptidylprolyl isomerase [Planctomycetota bacterium]|nr:peptidylprolyl isomerase [Planctomycetota bacterium]
MRLAKVLGSIACVCVASACVRAQLTPDRTYYGVGRPIPMQVHIPEGLAGSEAYVELHDARSVHRDPADVVERPAPVRSAVEAGPVNLAVLFPSIWGDPGAPVRYAQLVVGDVPVGSSVVVAPMRSPRRAMLYSRADGKAYYVDPVTGRETFEPRAGEIVYTPDPPAFTGVCAWVDRHVVFETSLGTIEFRLRPDEAPNTVQNFMRLVEGGFYTDVVFHRVVPRTRTGEPFVVQVGDPTGEGSGTPGYAIDLEASGLRHEFGVLSMARDADPNTNGSQVFVCLSRAGTARLDGQYTAFGRAVWGADTILALAATPVKGDRPIDPPVLRGARLIDAPPIGRLPAWAERPADAPEAR